MSMILDALTRAEHERQLENQPDLKFVTPVKTQKNSPNKIWGWVVLGLLANALLLFFVLRSMSGDTKDEQVLAEISNDPPQKIISIVEPKPNEQLEPIVNEPAKVNEVEVQPEATPLTLPVDERPLAMEVNSAQIPDLDRPLIYEAKQTKAKPRTPIATTSSKSPNKVQPETTKKGKVSFSTTELTADDAVPIVEKPKLLIDQGEATTQSVVINTQVNSSHVPSLRDLPESSRSNLSQYEVNVHVFDDDPIRRFVLINMDKYKEGDRIINNGPLVEEITPNGVVVDYGSGRALLPPK